MKKLIAGLAMLAMTLPIAAESLHDKVKDYLDEAGFPKTEYLTNQRILFYSTGDFKFQQAFLLGNKPLIADFIPYTAQPIDENTAVAEFDKGADFYLFENKWYADPECDGINGNEELYNE